MQTQEWLIFKVSINHTLFLSQRQPMFPSFLIPMGPSLFIKLMKIMERIVLVIQQICHFQRRQWKIKIKIEAMKRRMIILALSISNRWWKREALLNSWRFWPFMASDLHATRDRLIWTERIKASDLIGIDTSIVEILSAVRILPLETFIEYQCRNDWGRFHRW